jgi:hypothetical protein
MGVPSRETVYPATALLSVEGVQVRSISRGAAVAVSPAGTVGLTVSAVRTAAGVVTAATSDGALVLPAASDAGLLADRVRVYSPLLTRYLRR